jgi:hypothetical protein
VPLALAVVLVFIAKFPEATHRYKRKSTPDARA